MLRGDATTNRQFGGFLFLWGTAFMLKDSCAVPDEPECKPMRADGK
jgi:hypothetical protein